MCMCMYNLDKRAALRHLINVIITNMVILVMMNDYAKPMVVRSCQIMRQQATTNENKSISHNMN